MTQPAYPGNLLEFGTGFHNDQVCPEYLIQSPQVNLDELVFRFNPGGYPVPPFEVCWVLTRRKSLQRSPSGSKHCQGNKQLLAIDLPFDWPL
jgi:hypothetical protein